MANYISSIANRFYCATEQSYGVAGTVSAANRFPALRLQASQAVEQGRRYDKTGSRTYLGTSKQARRQSAFQVRTYLTSWNGIGEPSYGPLFHAALGAVDPVPGMLQISGMTNSIQLTTSTAHGFRIGSAISVGDEIRFVTGTPDSVTLTLNAPFSETIEAGTDLGPAVTYRLTTDLSSVSLYDYWDPTSAVSRLIVGAAVDSFGVSVNGDYHEFAFSGPAADLLDSTSFQPGTSGLALFPSEPPMADFDYSIVPGHLGQVWLGAMANQFYVLSAANIKLKNNLESRINEFGSVLPRAVVPGRRQVSVDFSVYAQDDEQCLDLYRAAKQRNPISAMLQLGEEQGQLMGIYVPAMLPEIPEYDDSETRLQWRFTNNLAQGRSDDELFIAFA
jgi:hypothetical protein